MTVADKPVTCWKFVEIVEGIKEERITITPYTFVRIPISVLEGIEPFKADKSAGKGFEYDDCGEACVTGGYIHTFSEMNTGTLDGEMEYLAETVGKHDDYISASAEAIGCRRCPKVLAIQLWRCEIQAGTKYVEGEVEANDRKGYASDEITFKEMMLEIGVDIAGPEHEDERYEKYGELVKRIKN
jgi:hypothetical protein